MSKKLYRSETDKMIGGVCGGIAESLNFDSTIVRIIFVLIVLSGGTGLFLYIILWIVIPSASQINLPNEKVFEENKEEIKKEASKVVRKIKTDSKNE
jgi:phage shock protein C